MEIGREMPSQGREPKKVDSGVPAESLEGGGTSGRPSSIALPEPSGPASVPGLAEAIDKIEESMERSASGQVNLEAEIARWGITHRTGHHRKLDDTSTLREVAEALGFSAGLQSADWKALQGIPERRASSLVRDMVDAYNERMPEGVEILWDDDCSLGGAPGLYLVGRDWESFPELEMGPGRMTVDTAEFGCAIATNHEGGTCFFQGDDVGHLRGSMHPDWAAEFSKGYSVVMEDPGYTFEGGTAPEDLEEELDQAEDEFDPENDASIGEDGKTIYLYGKPWFEVQDVETLELETLRHMEIEGFFPNLFNISDHGNAHLVNLNWSQAYRDPDVEKLNALLDEMGLSKFMKEDPEHPHRGNRWAVKHLHGQDSIAYRVDLPGGKNKSGSARIEHPANAVAYREPEVAIALTIERELASLGLIDAPVASEITFEAGPSGKGESLRIRPVGGTHYLVTMTDGLAWAGTVTEDRLMDSVGRDLREHFGNSTKVAAHQLMCDPETAKDLLGEAGDDFVRSCRVISERLRAAGAMLEGLAGGQEPVFVGPGRALRIPVPLDALDTRLQARLLAALDVRPDLADLRGNPTGWVADEWEDRMVLVAREAKLAVFFPYDPRSGSDAVRARTTAASYAIDNPQEKKS